MKPEAGILAPQHSLQESLVKRTFATALTVAPGFAAGMNFQNVALRVSETEDLEAQDGVANLQIKNAPDDISIFRPEMKNTLALA
jgi:hypothetical protein